MSVEPRILTLHPQGKKGVNILVTKYETIKNCILDQVQKHEPILFKDLCQYCEEELRDSFDGKIIWYVVSVKLDLEARNILERIPGKSPQSLRITR